MVNIIHAADSVTQFDQLLGGNHQIFRTEHTIRNGRIQAQTFIDLITAHSTQVIAAVIKEKPLDKGFGAFQVHRIAGAHTTINFGKSFFAVAGRILTQAGDDIVIPIHHMSQIHTLDTMILKFLQVIFRQLSQFIDHQRIIFGNDIIHREETGQILLLDQGSNGVLLHFKQLGKNVTVGFITDRTQEGGNVELPATATAVKIDVDVIVDIKLNIHPAAAIRNHTIAVKHTAGGVTGLFKADPGRTVQLSNDDAFRAIDHEGPLFGHQRHIAHVDLFPGFVAIVVQQKFHMQRNIVNAAVLNAVNHIIFRFADLVTEVLDGNLAVLTDDGEHFVEDFMQPLVQPFGGRNILLEEIPVRIELQADQIGHRQHFLQFAEINTFCHFSPCVKRCLIFFTRNPRRPTTGHPHAVDIREIPCCSRIFFLPPRSRRRIYTRPRNKNNKTPASSTIRLNVYRMNRSCRPGPGKTPHRAPNGLKIVVGHGGITPPEPQEGRKVPYLIST